ncbi:MAG: ribokinase [Rhodoferax sp.]|nr:ribokinase [Rhodoferax sp.]
MILVAGSANLDFVVRASHIPAPGETVLGHDFQTFPGGKGANQAVACARSGAATTHLLLALGSDAFATPIEASLRDAGVHLHTVRASGLPTGTAFICVSDQAENAITVAPGANNALRAGDLPALAGFSHLLLQLETPLDTVAAYAKMARAQGVTVVLNAAPARALPADLLAVVDVLVVNEGELTTLSPLPGTLAQKLERLGVPCGVVTLGARGCCAHQGGRWWLQPGFAVNALDTTAAGDTFCGTLTAALSRHESLAGALRQASAAGALACLRLGAQSSMPTQAEVDAFLQTQPEASEHALATLQQYCGLAP